MQATLLAAPPNGALIFVEGIWELINPPQQRVVLSDLHANVWWGALLFLLGTAHCWRF